MKYLNLFAGILSGMVLCTLAETAAAQAVRQKFPDTTSVSSAALSSASSSSRASSLASSTSEVTVITGTSARTSSSSSGGAFVASVASVSSPSSSSSSVEITGGAVLPFPDFAQPEFGPPTDEELANDHGPEDTYESPEQVLNAFGDGGLCSAWSSVRRCTYEAGDYAGFRVYVAPWCNGKVKLCWPVCRSKKLLKSELVVKCPEGCKDDGEKCFDPATRPGTFVEYYGSPLLLVADGDCAAFLTKDGANPCAKKDAVYFRDQSRSCVKDADLSSESSAESRADKLRTY